MRSYFNKNQDHRIVTKFLHRFVRELDYVVTDTEKEALLLENSMIKKHAPKFNVRLRDDKTYFSLRLDTMETWPCFTIVRKRKPRDGVVFFGPYTSALACRRTLQYLNTMFPLRTCSDSVLANRTRPCISYEIKRCVAPCVDYVDREEYMRIVDQAIMFLKGRNRELVDDLRRKMTEVSDRLDYESAAVLRDRIQAIETTVDQPHVTKRTDGAFDVVGVYRTEDEIDLVVLFVRDGVLTSSASYAFDTMHDTDELLRSFLGQFYTATESRQVPPEIILPEDCSEMELMRLTLAEIRGADVKLVVPERGEKKKHLLLATKNAELAWMQRRRDAGDTEQLLENLRSSLDLVQLPRRIECFDISNLMGTHVVGSCVGFADARPDKSRYRRFKVKTVDGQDDFASMREVLRRRLARGLRDDDLPDLLVIDGGKGQLSVVHEVLRELKVDSVDLVSLAKARSGRQAHVTEQTKERIFRPGSSIPIILDQRSPEMRLLVRIRDEAHRFAITYHRRLRAKAQVSSMLELVPGIGRRKSMELLRSFGSVAGVREASSEDLGRVKGMNSELVERLIEFLENQGRIKGDEPREEEP